MPGPRLIEAYHEGLVAASRSAMLELALALGKYREAIVLVGGWVPCLLVERYGQGDFQHIGSIDIDLAVDPNRLGPVDYATIVELIERRGYSMRRSRDGRPIPFKLRDARALPIRWAIPQNLRRFPCTWPGRGQGPSAPTRPARPPCSRHEGMRPCLQAQHRRRGERDAPWRWGGSMRDAHAGHHWMHRDEGHRARGTLRGEGRLRCVLRDKPVSRWPDLGGGRGGTPPR